MYLKDDELLFDYNVQERVNDFVEAAMAQVCNCISVISNQLRCTGALFLILVVKETVVSYPLPYFYISKSCCYLH